MPWRWRPLWRRIATAGSYRPAPAAILKQYAAQPRELPCFRAWSAADPLGPESAQGEYLQHVHGEPAKSWSRSSLLFRRKKPACSVTAKNQETASSRERDGASCSLFAGFGPFRIAGACETAATSRSASNDRLIGKSDLEAMSCSTNDASAWSGDSSVGGPNRVITPPEKSIWRSRKAPLARMGEWCGAENLMGAPIPD